MGEPNCRDHLLAVLALVAATVLWGTSFVAIKAIAADIPPISQAVLRFAVALLVLWPLARRRGTVLARGRVPLLLGLTGFALVIASQNVGVTMTGAADATLLMGGGHTLLAAGMGVVLLGERPSRPVLAGLLATFVGLVLAFGLGRGTTEDVGGTTGTRLGGDLLVLAATAGAAAFTVLGRRAFGSGAVLAMLVGSMRYGVLALLPFAAVELVVVDASMPSAAGLGLLLYLGVGGSALAYALLSYALSHLTAATVGVVGNLEVVVGVAAAAVLLGEPVARGQVLGTVLVLGGAILAALVPSPPAKSANPRPRPQPLVAT